MKELEDFNWFPKTLRNFQTEYIGYVVSKFDIYKPFIKILQKQKFDTMFDLCSGSGEPATHIFTESNAFEYLILSDKFPNNAFRDTNNIKYIKMPLDVLSMEFNEGSTYTMFNAFHHFSEEEQKAICNNIIKANASAYFVEILFPSPIHLIKTFLASSVGVLILSPFIKPFSWKRMFFTYLIPLNVLSICIDGMISVLKSKTVKQYQSYLNNDASNIEIYKLSHPLAPLLIIKINESH